MGAVKEGLNRQWRVSDCRRKVCGTGSVHQSGERRGTGLSDGSPESPPLPPPLAEAASCGAILQPEEKGKIDQLWVTKLEQKHSYRPDFLKCCCFFCLFFGGVLVCFGLFVTCLSYLLIAVVVWAYIRYLKPNSTKHMYNPNSLISPLAVNVIQLLWI